MKRRLAYLGWVVAAALAVALFVSHWSVPKSESRSIEARITGIAWAPLRAHVRGAGRDLRVPDTQHETPGVTLLLDGRTREALATLTSTAQSTNDPRAWNDLAVAFHENAIRYQTPELFADALAACDQALSLDSRSSEALFNRALTIEKLGLRDDAREAWTRYLAADSGAWANEAQEHLQRLTPVTPFLQTVDRDFKRLANDAAAVHALARRDPQEARARAEMEILGRWGASAKKGDAADANAQLAIARELGRELTRIHGDRMLESAVATIDAAPDPVRTTLASAHADYAAGLKAFQNNHPVDAEPLLRRAADGFERAGSPMAHLAHFFTQNTIFEQGRHDEAAHELERLLRTAPAGFDAYRAQVLWQLGVCRAVKAEWGASMQLLEQSAVILDRLGEVQNAASVHRVMAVIYDRAGDPATAWKHRMIALRGAGLHSDLALEKAVSSVAGAAILRRKWQTAASFLTLEAGIARRIGDDVQLADALLLRAAVRGRLHDAAGARADLSDADAANGRAQDVAYHAYGRAAQSLVRAMLATSAKESASLLTESIDFESTKGDRVNLPGLFLQRGRARRRLGDARGAAADFERGMSEVELHRQSLPQGEARWGVFYSVEELFEEAIDLALQQNDATQAFAVAERARARSLLDVYDRAPRLDSRQLPSGTVVVEYAALPSRLAIFVADAQGISATTADCNRDVLTAEVDALSTALETNQTIASKRASAALFRRLVQPIAPRLLGATTVVFVPDSATATVPFNALVDERGDYLLQRFAILTAPSAALFEAATEHRREVRAPRSVLVIVNDDPGADADRLNSIDREAQQVSRAYRKAVVLQDENARLDMLTSGAASADVVHFAGHAVGDDSGFVPASIVLRDGTHPRRVEATELAHLRLPRTSVVVLAGCSTARGERRGPEGVISVARAFLAAGAPSVIATLWPIDDDDAATFFPRLHRRLAEGLSPAEALRSVQLESIQRGDVPPSLWAALQDIGS